MERQQIEWGIERTVLAGGGHAGNGGQRTGAGGTGAGGTDTGLRQVIISTERPVRSGGGIARAAGCLTAPYMRNPVVMWGHNYKEPPIGRATALEIAPGVGIVARFEFPPAGIHPLADTVRGLWDAGFINAASIGFLPLEWEMVDDPEGAEGGRREQIPVFTRWELYEFSLVAVPRDRDAVGRAFDALVPEAAAEQVPALDLPRILDGLSAVRRVLNG